MNYPEAFQDLVDCFKRLPGIGNKSAERLTYYVLSMEKEYVNDFSKAIGNIQDKIHYCKKCGHICEGEIVIYVWILIGIKVLFVLLKNQKMFLQWKK